MEIIAAKAEHFDSVYELMCELENDQMDRSRLFLIYSANLKNPDVHYFVASNDSEIVGFASVHVQLLLHHAAKVAELQEMIVSKKSQGHGIGSLLFEQAKEIAAKENCIQLEVCCNQKCKESHRFYLKKGMLNSHFKFIKPNNNMAG